MDAARVAVFRPGPTPLQDVPTRIERTLNSPLEMPALELALVPDDRVLIALDRDTPAAPELIAGVWKCLARRDISPDHVTILQPAAVNFAVQKDPRSALPVSVRSAMSWRIHDPTADDSCGYLATTSTGERIYMARDVLDADFVLPVGTTAYDPLLGYRGTSSVLFPGLSNVDAIRRAIGQGHTELSPTDHRPLRQMMDEIAWLLGIQFAVQVVPASSGGVLEVLAGSPEAVFTRGCALLDDHWLIELPERVETVVVAVPADASGHGWTQLGQALATARQLVTAGGRVVILSELDEVPGDGLKLLSECEDPLDALKPLRKTTPPDMIPATQLAHAASWARLFLLSHLEDTQVEDLFMLALGEPREVQRVLDSSSSCALIGTAQHTFGHVD